MGLGTDVGLSVRGCMPEEFAFSSLFSGIPALFIDYPRVLLSLALYRPKVHQIPTKI